MPRGDALTRHSGSVVFKPRRVSTAREQHTRRLRCYNENTKLAKMSMFQNASKGGSVGSVFSMGGTPAEKRRMRRYYGYGLGAIGVITGVLIGLSVAGII